VNAAVRPSIAAGVLAAGLCGCTASPGLRPTATYGGGYGGTEMVSRQTASANPSFAASTTPTPPPTPRSNDRTRASSLVSLYGELQTDRTEYSGESWDGSSNVAQVTFATEGACSDPDVSRDGQHLVFASTQHGSTTDIYVKPASGRTVTRLTTDQADDMMPVLDPSGTRVAFASNRSGNWDIYVMPVTGGEPMKLTDEPEHELHPSWSPDGSRLVYSKLGARSGRWEMWVVDMANPGIRRFLDYGLFPQWCPDPARSKILFQRARQRGSRFFSIWTIDYVNGDAVFPTEIVSAGNAAVINPAWSPDGSRIVFVTVVEPDLQPEDEPLEQSDLWVVNLDGSGRINLTNGNYANYQPVWSADGKVYFVSNRTGVDNIWSVSTRRAMSSRPQVTNASPRDLDDIPVGRP